MGRLASAFSRNHDQFTIKWDLAECDETRRSARTEQREQADGLFFRIRRDTTNNRDHDGWCYEPERDEDYRAERRRDSGQDARDQYEGDAEDGGSFARSRRHGSPSF